MSEVSVPPGNSHALTGPLMQARLMPLSDPVKKTENPKKTEISSTTANPSSVSESDDQQRPELLDPESDRNEENNEFQELLDIIYENRAVNIIYGKDRRTQITPAVLTGKKDVIYEHEIPFLVRKTSEEGFKDMLELNFKQALVNFKKSENIINVLWEFFG